MDYQKVAGNILFGGNILDNAMRGVFIEALVFQALVDHDDKRGAARRWQHPGLGWGPWDLQRGRHDTADRVRVQVRVKAAKQLWKQVRHYRLNYSLGFRTDETLPPYFQRDFPVETFGVCEPSGYRTDLFLLAWHSDGSQSDPNTYAFTSYLHTIWSPDVRRHRSGSR